MRRAWRNAVGLCVAAVSLGVGASAAPSRGDCTSALVGLDPSQANNSGGALLGGGIGQTFAAGDTLIRSLTVWRVEQQSTIGMHLYIMGTDSTGKPDRSRMVQDGPTLVVYGDGTYPAEIKWTFDPPVVLPSPGEYAFFLFQDPCLEYFDILATSVGALYPDGNAWYTGQTSQCAMNSNLHNLPDADYIFQVEFCHDVVTPTHKASWGKLKAIYR
jgi:(2Fe-2S) ferredoxin